MARRKIRRNCLKNSNEKTATRSIRDDTASLCDILRIHEPDGRQRRSFRRMPTKISPNFLGKCLLSRYIILTTDFLSFSLAVLSGSLLRHSTLFSFHQQHVLST